MIDSLLVSSNMRDHLEYVLRQLDSNVMQRGQGQCHFRPIGEEIDIHL